MRTRVAITRTANGVETAVEEAVELLGGIERFIHPGEKALLKPNLFNTEPPESGCTTDLELVLALGRLIQEAGGECVVGECPATAAYARPEMVYKAHRLEERCGAQGIGVRVLDRDRPVGVRVKGVVNQLYHFPETALQCPIFNIPKLKTHALTTLTCAVKNLFGLQQGGIKAHHHVSVANDPESFSHLLLDIYQAIGSRVRLNLVDAHVAMEGEGPAGGSPVPLGLVIAGADAVAVDVVASMVMGWDPYGDVGTNYLARERGLAPQEIEVVGVQVAEVERPFKKPQIHSDGEMFIRVRMPIELNEERCTSCGVCSQICPAGAIEARRHPIFHMERCIQCFCCVELCPNKALTAVRRATR